VWLLQLHFFHFCQYSSLDEITSCQVVVINALLEHHLLYLRPDFFFAAAHFLVGIPTSGPMQVDMLQRLQRTVILFL